MGLCCAPCAGRISLDEYADNINDAIAFIKGGSVKTVKKMEEQLGVLESIFNTGRNLIFGFYKKKRYVKTVR